MPYNLTIDIEMDRKKETKNSGKKLLAERNYARRYRFH
jgi:hypothetical protein